MNCQIDQRKGGETEEKEKLSAVQIWTLDSFSPLCFFYVETTFKEDSTETHETALCSQV